MAYGRRGAAKPISGVDILSRAPVVGVHIGVTIETAAHRLDAIEEGDQIAAFGRGLIKRRINERDALVYSPPGVGHFSLARHDPCTGDAKGSRDAEQRCVRRGAPGSHFSGKGGGLHADLFGKIICREAVILHHATNAPLHGAFATGRWIAVAQHLPLAGE